MGEGPGWGEGGRRGEGGGWGEGPGRRGGGKEAGRGPQARRRTVSCAPCHQGVPAAPWGSAGGAVMARPVPVPVPVPQAGPAFTIKPPCGWSRFALRTRAGTSAKCSCWTSSMTPSTTAAGSTSPSTVRPGRFLGPRGPGPGRWGRGQGRPVSRLFCPCCGDESAGLGPGQQLPLPAPSGVSWGLWGPWGAQDGLVAGGVLGGSRGCGSGRPCQPRGAFLC